MANISIDVADNEARQDLQDLEDYVDSAAFDKQSLSVSQNGTYTAPAGKAYSPVVVDVPNTYTQSDEGKVVSSGALVSQTTRNVTTNGTYNTTTNNSVVVDVQGQPWAPLEDGYSNFWFEVDDFTKSFDFQLKFYAKNADATIDWGDDSGEVALDTLTPTHTYSKAGKYVVKVKGVTGISQQRGSNLSSPMDFVLKHVELNSEVTYVQDYAFRCCMGLEDFKAYRSGINIRKYAFYNCQSLKTFSAKMSYVYSGSNDNPFYGTKLVELDFSDSMFTSLPDNIYFISGCNYLKKVTYPSTLVTFSDSIIGAYALEEIHFKSTTPPTRTVSLVSNSFTGYNIYVPVGCGDAYKTAWSNYANQIVEESE